METNDITVTSHIFNDGRIAEMIYGPLKKMTGFALWENNKMNVALKIQLDDESKTNIIPLPAKNGLVAKKFVLFPSTATEYTSNLELYDEVRSFLGKYITLPSSFLTVAAAYVMMSWVHDQFHTLPYLRVIGLYGTGKTRFLEVTGNISYKSMIAGGSISQAAVFRTIDMIKGTLVFDEADFRSSEMWSEIVKILNSGHTKGFPVVRMEKNKGDKFDPTTFEVFGPKILASRERFVDEALESRCLTQYLLPLKTNTAPTHLPKEFEQEALDLRNKLLMFRFKNLGHIPIDETTVKDSGILRLKQSALALTCVAKAIDENILTKVTEFLKNYENELQAQQINDVKADVLICILGCHKRNKTEKIRIGEIAKEFESRFKEHYSDIQTEKYDYDSKMFFPNYDIRISPKRVGSIVRKLGIGLRRDGHGFYIPIPEELRRIQLLAERYGIDQYPESN